MARKIVITSGKGGVGKTTICANIGLALATLGQRVVMIDADIGLNNLDVIMNIEGKVLYDIVDVIEGKCRLKQALVQDYRIPNLYTLASRKTYLSKPITSYDVKKIVDTLGLTFDYCLIDCPAGIDSGFHKAVYSADEAIVVTTPHLSSIRDADKVINVLNSYKLTSVKIVVNRLRGDLVIDGQMMNENTICSLLKTNLLGVVPDQDNFSLSVSMPSSVYSNSPFCILANNLHYGFCKMYDYTSKYKGVLGAVRRKARRM